MKSANSIDEGRWSLTVYTGLLKHSVAIDRTTGETIALPEGSAVFSETKSKMELDGEERMVTTVVHVRPHDHLTYAFRLGQIQRYKIDFSSSGRGVSLSSLDDGVEMGFGVCWNALIGTWVTPAVSLEAGYNRKKVRLERFESIDGVQRADLAIVEDQLQGALSVSKRLGKWEPYGGVRLYRSIDTWVDRLGSAKAKGTRKEGSAYVGIRFEGFVGEALVAEASIGGEEFLGIGLEIVF